MEKLLRHFACILLASCCVESVAAAEKKDTRPVLDPPPPALPVKLTVPRNRRTDVPLRIYGVQNEPLRYIIKTPPAHGKLSNLRSTGREVSVVTYEPPADLAVTADRFTFSVQSHAGVSAPVAVTISIVDEPPRLIVPFAVEFDELLAGATATKEIEVANRGGGLIEGEIEVDAPFKVEGRRNYRLQAGEYTYFKIIFAPSEGGLFRREIRYTSDREFITTLTGSAQTPIAAEPYRIELRHASDSAVRTGAFEIVNRTGNELSFQVVGGPRLQLPEKVTVAAHGRSAIPVSTRPDDVSDLEGEVRVESQGFSLKVPVRAAKVGPILRLGQQSLALGRVDAGRGMQTAIEVENAGGTVARITAEIGPPFALAETAFDLMPREKKRLGLFVQPSEPKRYRAWLKFKAGAMNSEVEVDAELVSSTSTSRPASDEMEKPPAPVKPADLPPWTPDLNIVKDIGVTAVTPTTATVQWPAELNGAKQYRIDRLVLTRDSAKELRNVWLEIPGTTFARQGPLWTAKLIQLTPAQSQTIRVVPIKASGRAGAALFNLDFITPPKRSLVKPRVLPTLFVCLLVSAGVLIWRRVRRQMAEPISGF